MRTLVPMSLDELPVAPFRFRASGHLSAPLVRVFDELADPSRWFPLIASCAWHGRVGGTGSVREVRVRLVGAFREIMLAWDIARDHAAARIAFTMTETSSPLVSRMAEDFTLTPELSGVRLDWTVAVVPTALGRPARPVLRRMLGWMFASYRPRLERLAAAPATSPPAPQPVRGTPAS